MEIETKDQPLAGERFRFSVSHAPGANILVFVDTLKIFEGDCPDPPCHESVFVPEGTRGSTLRIVAKSTAGKIIEREFNISESYSEPGAAAASAA
jgi:hypothetical protein